MPVAQAAATTFEEFYLLAVVGYLAQKFSGLCVEYYCAAGYFDSLVLTVFARTAVAGARTAVACKYMALVFKR